MNIKFHPMLSIREFVNLFSNIENYYDIIALSDSSDELRSLINRIIWTDPFDNHGRKFNTRIFDLRLTEIRLSNIKINSKCSPPISVKELTLKKCIIESLNDLINIDSLTCDNCIFSNACEFIQCHQVKNLELINTNISWRVVNWDIFSRLEEIKIKSIHVTSDDLISLKRVKNLNSIKLINCNQVTSDFLEDLINLQSLSIIDCLSFNGNSFKKFNRLKILHLSGFFDTVDLNDLTDLRELYVHTTHVSLCRLTEVESLHIYKSLSPNVKFLNKLKTLVLNEVPNTENVLKKLPGNIESLTIISSFEIPIPENINIKKLRIDTPSVKIDR